MSKRILDVKRGLPLLLAGLVILIDQISKHLIASRWPIPSGSRHVFITDVFSNDFLHIIHVRNTAIAFSLGQNLPDPVKRVLFVIMPVIVLAVLTVYYFRSTEFTRLQRWATAGILGGGIGNIIDRIFRPDGVVDFISVKFYGLFGFERWPTFNIADTSVVICCLLLLATIFLGNGKKAKAPLPVLEGKSNEQKT
ncbi:MAG: signal peptidase II [Treponema sp.]|nr:signal peptidase II [Treponema sp.]